jgi:hypothetical protein
MRERVWVDPFKIGKAAVFQKMANKLSRKKKSDKDRKVPLSFSFYLSLSLSNLFKSFP